MVLTDLPFRFRPSSPGVGIDVDDDLDTGGMDSDQTHPTPTGHGLLLRVALQVGGSWPGVVGPEHRRR